MDRIFTSYGRKLIYASAIFFFLSFYSLGQTNVFINEIHYDNAGADTNEAIEICAPTGTLLNGWSLVLYNGNDKKVYKTTNLSGTVSGSNGIGYFVQQYTSNGIQNGAPDGVALVNASNTVVQFLSYEGTITALDGPANGMTSQNIGVSESSSTPSNFSLQLKGTGSNYSDFTWESPAQSTFGVANNSQTVQGANTGGSQITIFINEIHYDNAGTDTNEAIEIAAPAGTSLNGWSLVLYNGNDKKVYNTTSLTGTISGSSGVGYLVKHFNTNGLQNGAPDGVALVNASNTVVQFLSYEGTITAEDGPANGMTSQDIGVSETSSTPQNFSLQLTGTGSKYEDFTWAAQAQNTFGAINNNQTFNSGSNGGGNGSYTLISAIQGSGSTSPMVGQTVTVKAIVVGDFQDNDTAGFFIQEEDADVDSDIKTSEGVFVYAPSGTTVSVGDLVEVTGTVTEYYNQTQIGAVSQITKVSSGNTLPAPTVLQLPRTTAGDLEKYEGMHVKFTQDLFVTNTYLLGRGGELTLSSSDRLYQPTNVVAPGSQAIAKQASNALNSIVLDDASVKQNPDPVIFPGAKLTFANTVRGGDKVTNVQGVLAYRWSGFNLGSTSTNAYRIYPTQTPTFTNTNARTSNPTAVGGTLKVASFNVLNYFNGDGQGGGFPTARGARNLGEFNKQRTKIINAIIGLDADIIGLMEIENDGYDQYSAIQDLVNGINAQTSTTYAFVNPNVAKIGTDQIACGFLYKVSKVSLVGSTKILDSSINAQFNDTKNRPVLTQAFKETHSGNILTVAVNHFKSKGSSCDSLGDPDQNDGQGNCNQTRTNAANALISWLATDPTGSGSPYTLVIGDLNAYAMEDPITAFKNNGYTDLVKQHQGGDAYSYSFSGQWGYLDHALSNNSLTPYINKVAVWHINADEPYVLGYSEKYKTPTQIADYYSSDAHRSSDHDPVIVGVNLPALTLSANRIFTREMNVVIYPNQLEETLYIKTTPQTVRLWSIYDAFGKQILFGKLRNEITQVDTSQLPSGIYFIRIETKEGVITKKLLK